MDDFLKTMTYFGVSKQIPVTQVPSYGELSGTINGKPLGTYDGQVWSLNQDTPDDDEDGQHGSQA